MTHDVEDLSSRVGELVAEILGKDPSAVALETPFSELGFDSLALTTLLVTIEEQFEVEFDDAELERLYVASTPAGALQALQELLASRAGRPSIRS